MEAFLGDNSCEFRFGLGFDPSATWDLVSCRPRTKRADFFRNSRVPVHIILARTLSLMLTNVRICESTPSGFPRAVPVAAGSLSDAETAVRISLWFRPDSRSLIRYGSPLIGRTAIKTTFFHLDYLAPIGHQFVYLGRRSLFVVSNNVLATEIRDERRSQHPQAAVRPHQASFARFVAWQFVGTWDQITIMVSACFLRPTEPHF